MRRTAKIQRKMLFVRPIARLLLAAAFVLSLITGAAAQSPAVEGGAILAREPATLYTADTVKSSGLHATANMLSGLHATANNPVSAERLVVQMPARRNIERTDAGLVFDTEQAVDGGHVTFSVWRLPGHAGATTPPIYLLPDWSAAGLDAENALAEVMALAAVLGPDADVYIIGPRGLADGERGFACPGALTAPLSRTVSRDELAQWTAAFLDDCVRWWEDAGLDLAAYTLPEMAADVTDLARVLGHEGILVAGVGMGAAVGLWATQFADTPLARAILIRPPGAADGLISPAGLDDLLGRLGRRAAVAPTLFGLTPDLDGLLERAANRLALSPVATTVIDPRTGRAEVVTIGVADLQMALGEALIQAEADRAPRRIFEIVQGDHGWLGERALLRRRYLEFDLAAVAALCTAGIDSGVATALAEEAETAALGWGPVQWVGEICRPLAAQEAREALSLDIESLTTPLLFVIGDLDGNTSLLAVNALATEYLWVDDLLLENWTGRLDGEFFRQAGPVMVDFWADAYEAIPLASVPLLFEPLRARPFRLPAWQGDYYANRELTGDPVLTRSDDEIEFEWGADAPAPELAGDGFSVRWSQQVELPAGAYRFYAWSDDGARLWIDNVLVLDAWQEGPLRAYVVDVNLVQGLHDIRYEYFEASANALARLRVAYLTVYPEWIAAYYPNVELAGEPVVVRNEPAPNSFWGQSSPAPGAPPGNFSARWETELALTPGAYTWRVTANGGVRLYVDEELVIDAWENVGRRVLEVDRILTGATSGSHATGNTITRLRVEYFALGGAAELSVRWLRRAPPVGPQVLIDGPARAATGASLNLAVEATPEANRSVAGILWDMGDNTQYTEAQIEHAFAAPGFYDVTVIVTDSAGIAGGVSRQVRVDDELTPPDAERRPVAALDAPVMVEAGNLVVLDAGASLGVNPIVRYRWDFGDGAYSAAAWVAKIYQTPGLYNVRLRVEDDAGLSASRSQLVLVLPVQAEPSAPLRVAMPDLAFESPDGTVTVAPQAGAPEAVIVGRMGEQAVLFDVNEEGALTLNVPANQPIVLDARASVGQGETPVVAYVWDIADGFSTATDAVIELVFAAAAQYRVELTVTDAEGVSVSQLIVINVIE